MSLVKDVLRLIQAPGAWGIIHSLAENGHTEFQEALLNILRTGAMDKYPELRPPSIAEAAQPERKPEIPDTVNIMDVEYDVVEIKDLTSPDEETTYYGIISHDLLLVRLAEDLVPVVKLQALIHEAMHGLIHQTGHFDFDAVTEERIVQLLGCQLPKFLRDNPQIVDLILRG